LVLKKKRLVGVKTKRLVGGGQALVLPGLDFLDVTRGHGAGGWHDQRIAGRSADAVDDFGNIGCSGCVAFQIQVTGSRSIVMATLAIVGKNALDLPGIT
jgi:hypothetical protein